MSITIEDLDKEYMKNKQKYDSVTEHIKKTIVGRSCHHRVVLLNILRNALDINRYLEIGVHNGTSMSYLLCVENKPLLNCIGIDLFEDTPTHKGDKLSYQRTLENIKKNNKSNSPIELIKGNSFHQSTVDKLRYILKENNVDLLFIDALHTYEGIQNDFTTYSKFVKSKGYIVLDDYNHHWPDIVNFVEKNILENKDYHVVGTFQENTFILQKV